RYRARKLLAAGVLLFAAGLYFLASFIWLVEISGNDRLENSQILEFLEENGLGIGAFRGTINYRDMEIALLAHFPADIAFASVSIRGTRAMIDIYETIQPPEIIDTSIPADIIAAKDGLIISIATSAGTPQVRPGDVVAAGDVLVAGELRIAASDYDETLYHSEYVRAASRVLARMYYTLVLEVPLDIVERVFTGNIVRNRAIIISERNFNIWRPRANFTESDIITKETQLILGRNYPMPFWLITTEYREYELVRRRRSLDEAMHFAYEQLTARILADFAEAEIIRQELEFFEGNNSVHIEVFLVTIERIDEVKEIDVLAED
ncbi:MAG: sporulation protein YqfD, partial [Defluviitaleaceae bacterium]|nr:sporulation protein YqfD [Defluviitaleaceae bacterium]